MTKRMFSVLLTAPVLYSCNSEQGQEGKPVGDAGAVDRTVLPIKEPTYPAITELDARNAKAPARFDVKAPKNAPNVVIVLIDDIGFGHSMRIRGTDPYADAGTTGRQRAEV